MTKASRSQKTLPLPLVHQLQKLGENFAVARKRRRISMKSMAERMMVSLETVQRLEKGDPAVGIGIILTALWVLGLHRRLNDLVSPNSDEVGLQEEIRNLPRDFRKRSSGKTGTSATDDLDF